MQKYAKVYCAQGKIERIFQQWMKIDKVLFIWIPNWFVNENNKDLFL